MTPQDAGGPAEYELTIEGGLGPVLRWALRPSSVVESHRSTTIRAVCQEDVAELVAQLDSCGLRIEGVWALPRTPGSRPNH